MKKFSTFFILIFLLASVSLACNFSLPRSGYDAPKANIAYETNETGNHEIKLYNSSSHISSFFMNDTANYLEPRGVYSNGRIEFVSDRENQLSLYSMDYKTGVITRVPLDKQYSVISADWSRDGKYIVAAISKDCDINTAGCTSDIYVMNADGTNLKNITQTRVISEYEPRWSPDGENIAFYSNREQDFEIYKMDKDGKHLIQLTSNTFGDGDPSWSPDGEKIVFDSNRDGDWDLYIMNADGTETKSLTQNITNDFYPDWSPDGNWITYDSDSDGNIDVFVIDIDGKNQYRVTNDKNNQTHPCWVVEGTISKPDEPVS